MEVRNPTTNERQLLRTKSFEPATPEAVEAPPPVAAPQPASAESETTPQLRGTLETAAAAAEMRAHDTATQQVRAAIDARLDAPSVSSDTDGDSSEAGPRRSATSRKFTLEEPGSTSPSQQPNGPLGARTRARPPAIPAPGTAGPEGVHEPSHGTEIERIPPEGFASVDDDLIFNGTDGNDDYRVSQGDNGSLTVTNQASGRTFTANAAAASDGATFNLRDGDDQIRFDDSVTYDIAVDAGEGDDLVNASRASGEYTIRGRGGDDRLSGGRGMNIIYGDEGADRVQGNVADDQLHGGDGDDVVVGSLGNDLLNGGDGADELHSGFGSDAIYADAEDSVVDPGSFSVFNTRLADSSPDTIVREGGGSVRGQGANDTVATFDGQAVDDYLAANDHLVLTGSPEFVARTRADLGVLLGTGQGRGLLDALAEGGEDITFVEKLGGAGGTYNHGSGEVSVGNWASTYSAERAPRHPLPVMFHELVHAYQFQQGAPTGATRLENGRTVPNIELEATGLPYFDAEGTLHPANELPFTDNRLRAELGLPLREGYGGTRSPAAGPAGRLGRIA